MFEITGKIGQKSYKLGFRRTGEGADDYIVSGDDAAIEKLLDEAKEDHGVLGLPPEDWSFAQGYLHSEYSANALACKHVFDSVSSVNTDWEQADGDAVY